MVGSNTRPKYLQIAPRVERMVHNLGRKMPNTGGPREKTRRLYAAVAQSIILYGAPVWAKNSIITRKNIKTLRRGQRRMAIRTIKAYRPVSEEAALTLAGMIPYDHLARAYLRKYWESRGGRNTKNT